MSPESIFCPELGPDIFGICLDIVFKKENKLLI